jgi:hypothetical protein
MSTVREALKVTLPQEPVTVLCIQIVTVICIQMVHGRYMHLAIALPCKLHGIAVPFLHSVTCHNEPHSVFPTAFSAVRCCCSTATV